MHQSAVPTETESDVFRECGIQLISQM